MQLNADNKLWKVKPVMYASIRRYSHYSENRSIIRKSVKTHL